MSTTTSSALTADEVDDLLYFTRANEAQDLLQTINELAQKYQCTPKDILEACKDAENGNTVLHYCSANGLTALLPQLLSQVGKTPASPLINARNDQGNTPLHWAAYNGHLEVVKVLVTGGADMWLKNGAGHLAMFEAERADRNEVVQYLLEAGGKEVERMGTEGQPSAEDVADVEKENAEEGPSSGAVQAGANGDVKTED